jgi:hypothetical protein
MQADIPLSVLDYLGHAGQWSQGLGRSLFRRYEAPRLLAFGNTYSRLVGLLDEAMEVTLCDESFAHCDAWPVEPERIFQAQSAGRRPAQLASVGLLRALAEYSVREAGDAISSSGAGRASITLSSQSSLPLGDSNQFLLGGQDWWQSAGTLTEVDLEFRFSAHGPAIANARAQLIVGVELIVIGAEFKQLRNGDVARMRVDYLAERDTGPLQLMLSGLKNGAGEGRFELLSAQVRFPAATAKDATNGVKVHEIGVIRASRAAAQ